MTSDATVIPRSTRIEFQLTAPKSFEERMDFTTLQAETTTIVKNFKNELKNKIIESIRIKIKALNAKINDYYSKSIHTIISVVSLSKGRSLSNAHHITTSLLQQYSTQMMMHTDIDTNTFIETYRRLQQLDAFPTLTTHATSTNAQENPTNISHYF